MNDRGHFYISILKSFIRIFGCVGIFFGKNISYFATAFILAEGLGILEEVFDKR